MSEQRSEFPYQEVANFDTVEEALKAGWKKNQIWSVDYADDDEVDEDGERWGCQSFGPPWMNRGFGFTVTKETHDGDTFIDDWYEMGPDDDEEEE